MKICHWTSFCIWPDVDHVMFRCPTCIFSTSTCESGNYPLSLSTVASELLTLLRSSKCFHYLRNNTDVNATRLARTTRATYEHDRFSCYLRNRPSSCWCSPLLKSSKFAFYFLQCLNTLDIFHFPTILSSHWYLNYLSSFAATRNFSCADRWCCSPQIVDCFLIGLSKRYVELILY